VLRPRKAGQLSLSAPKAFYTRQVSPIRQWRVNRPSPKVLPFRAAARDGAHRSARAAGAKLHQIRLTLLPSHLKTLKKCAARRTVFLWRRRDKLKVIRHTLNGDFEYDAGIDNA
jgi:hypothetical protein